MKGQGRPTAAVKRVDVSTNGRASAVPANPETTLFRAYGSLEPGQYGMARLTTVVYDRVEPCACGGQLVDDGRAISRMVKEHNSTALHRAWRKWREMA